MQNDIERIFDMPPIPLSVKTLMPLSMVAVVAVGSFHLSASHSKIEFNETKIRQIETALGDFETKSRSNYVEIIQRLARIEEAIKKATKSP
jgi:hypothetical protein